jgi:hypothetical protein
MEEDDRRLLRRKIACKKVNAKKEGLTFCLTEDDIIHLLGEAGITVVQWGFSGFHLARRGDLGNYDVGNCRFIPATQNYKEKKITEKSRAASRENIKKATTNRTPEEKGRIAALGGAACYRKNGPITSPTSESELRERFLSVSHLPLTRHGSLVVASVILGVTPQSAGRMRRLWVEMGLMCPPDRFRKSI